MEKKDDKNVIIVALLMTVVFMSVGYVILSTDTQANKMSTSINLLYRDVQITNISGIEIQGNAENIDSDISGKTSITVYPLLQEAGDKIIYTINVKNKGTQESKLKSIEITPIQEDYILYSIDNIKLGDRLEANDSMMFTLTVEFNEEYESIINDAKELTITLNYER